MTLSDRLDMSAGMVTPGYRLADVGTDHGFVPIWLIRNGIIPSAIAMDINRGPLERAAEHIREAGLEQFIETRLSDGLAALKTDEADSVVIAGMGGALTVRILSGNPAADLNIHELILQPQSEIAKVRYYLEESGWKIDREDMVLEDGKFYPAMHCIPGKMHLTPRQAEYGPLLLKEKHPVLLQYLKFRERVLNDNLQSLRKAESDKADERRREILGQLEEIREIRREFCDVETAGE